MSGAAMTKQRLADIAVRANQSARRPWYVHENDRFLLVRDRDGNAVCRVSDIEYANTKQRHYAEFIAHARSDIPALVSEIRRLWRIRKAAQAVVDAQNHRSSVAVDDAIDDLEAALATVSS